MQTTAFTLLSCACTAAFISTLLWPAGHLTRQIQDLALPRRPGQSARWIAGIASLLYLALIVALAAVPAGRGQTLFPPGGAAEPLFGALLLLARIAAVLTFGAGIYAGLAWRGRYWAIWHRIHYTLVAAALIVFTVWLAFFDLTGFEF